VSGGGARSGTGGSIGASQAARAKKPKDKIQYFMQLLITVMKTRATGIARIGDFPHAEPNNKEN